MVKLSEKLDAMFGGSELPSLISRQQAADLLGVNIDTMRNMINAGAVHEVSGTKKVQLQEVCKFIADGNLNEAGIGEKTAEHVVESMKVS